MMLDNDMSFATGNIVQYLNLYHALVPVGASIPNLSGRVNSTRDLLTGKFALLFSFVAVVFYQSSIIAPTTCNYTTFSRPFLSVKLQSHCNTEC